MAKTFTPRAYQRQAVDHIINVPRCGLWAGMGMGKTVSTLTALDAFFVAGESAPALVVAPLRVARDTWTAEAAKWHHLRDIKVRPINGSIGERRTALRDKDANVFTINYENLPWLVDTVGKQWPFSTVVADESTKLKGFRVKEGGARARALGRVAHPRVKRFIELTGTPAPNGLVDLWGQIWFLDAGQRLGKSFESFQMRWFQAKKNSGGFSQLFPLPHAQAEIEARLKDICLTIDPRDHFDIKDPIRTTVPVELPARARGLYTDMERELFMQIGEYDIEAFNAAARTMKCLQICNGAVYVDDSGAWQEVHNAKLEALEDVMEEAAGMPILVAYQFKSDLERLRKAFPKGRLLSDAKEFKEFLTGNYPLGFAHPKSLGHGVDGLQNVSNIIAFFGHWWDLELRQQIIERVGPVRQAQAGFDRPVFIYDIVAADTIDEVVLARHESKREVQDLLLEAMKRKGYK